MPPARRLDADVHALIYLKPNLLCLNGVSAKTDPQHGHAGNILPALHPGFNQFAKDTL
jgi:hypothetical protein